jgi:hypothetical protein
LGGGKRKKEKRKKQSKNNEKLVQEEEEDAWIGLTKLQRERSHIATITMNPKFMFLTIIVVLGDHNYRNLIRVRYRISCFQRFACLQRS